MQHKRARISGSATGVLPPRLPKLSARQVKNMAVVLEAGIVDKLERQLDGARLLLVALLAVITDEQFRSVKAALEAVDEVSETSRAALEELWNALGRR